MKRYNTPHRSHVVKTRLTDEEYADSRTERGKCLLHEICAQFGFDSLSYQSLDGLLEAIGLDRDKVCTYCWTGKE